jgi:hypothetical protein
MLDFLIKYQLLQYFSQGLGIGVIQMPVMYLIYQKIKAENNKLHQRIDSVEKRQDDKSKKISDLKETVMLWIGKFDSFYTVFFEYLPNLEKPIVSNTAREHPTPEEPITENFENLN